MPKRTDSGRDHKGISSTPSSSAYFDQKSAAGDSSRSQTGVGFDEYPNDPPTSEQPVIGTENRAYASQSRPPRAEAAREPEERREAPPIVNVPSLVCEATVPTVADSSKGIFSTDATNSAHQKVNKIEASIPTSDTKPLIEAQTDEKTRALTAHDDEILSAASGAAEEGPNEPPEATTLRLAFRAALNDALADVRRRLDERDVIISRAKKAKAAIEEEAARSGGCAYGAPLSSTSPNISPSASHPTSFAATYGGAVALKKSPPSATEGADPSASTSSASKAMFGGKQQRRKGVWGSDDDTDNQSEREEMGDPPKSKAAAPTAHSRGNKGNSRSTVPMDLGEDERAELLRASAAAAAAVASGAFLSVSSAPHGSYGGSEGKATATAAKQQQQKGPSSDNNFNSLSAKSALSGSSKAASASSPTTSFSPRDRPHQLAPPTAGAHNNNKNIRTKSGIDGNPLLSSISSQSHLNVSNSSASGAGSAQQQQQRAWRTRSGSSAAVRARSNTFLERQRVADSAAPFIAPIRSIVPSALALEAQALLASEFAWQAGGGGGENDGQQQQQQQGGVTFADTLSPPSSNEGRGGGGANSPLLGGGSGGGGTRASSFNGVRQSIRRSRMATNRVTRATGGGPTRASSMARGGAGGPTTSYGSSLPHYSGNRNNNKTVDSPYPVSDTERINLYLYHQQANYLAGGGAFDGATAAPPPQLGKEDADDSDDEKGENPFTAANSPSSAMLYRNTSAYKRKRTSFNASGGGSGGGGSSSDCPQQQTRDSSHFYPAGGGCEADAFFGAAQRSPPLWERLTRWLRDAQTYDTDDSIVLLIDTLYVVFTTIATIIVANLLVVYYPNSQNIAPLEDNDSHSFSNRYLQPSMLTALQGPFALWMVTRCFVRHRYSDLVIVDDTQSLAVTYLSSKSFYWDAFMTVPVEAIFIGSRPESFVVLACRHLFRWPRCLTLLRSSNPFASLRIWYLFYIIFFGFVALVHCSAAIFPMIEGSVEGDVPFSFPLTYVTSLYLIVTSTAGVGYGDAFPTQPYSRSFIFVLQYTGAFMFAGLTAYLSHLILRSDAQRSFVAGLRQTIRSAIIYYKLPWAIEKDISLSLQPTLEKHTEIQYFSQLLNQILPLRLAQEISIFQFAKMYVTSVPCFRSLPNEVALRLAAISERRFYPRNQEIITMGEEGDEMFLILSGKLEVKGMRSAAISKAKKGGTEDRYTHNGDDVSPSSFSGAGAHSFGVGSSSSSHTMGGTSSSNRNGEEGGPAARKRSAPRSFDVIPENYGTIARLRVGHHFGLPSLFERTVRAVTVVPLYAAAEVLVLSRERFGVVCNEYPHIFEDLVDEQKVGLREVLPHTRQFRYAAEASRRASKEEGKEESNGMNRFESEQYAASDDGVDYSRWFFELQTDFPLKMMERPRRPVA